MVSFYLASRHVVEAPACQLSTTVGRPLLTEDTELWKLLNSEKEICSVPLSFGVGLGCRTRKDLDQDNLMTILRNGQSSSNTFNTSSETLREANEAVWKAAHCESSTWQAVRTDHSFCGYEFCLESNPPEGPMKALNLLLTRDGEQFKIFAGVLPIFVCS